MPDEHSKFSPSGASRWLRCPGSIDLSKGRERTSSYAEQGTLAHSTAEAILQGRDPPKEADEEMVENVRPYTSLVESLRNCDCEGKSCKCESELIDEFIEVRMLHTSLPNYGGTVDYLAIFREGEHIVAHLCDLKYGVLPVSAVDNAQLKSYAGILRSWYPLPIDEYRMTIVQPRALDSPTRSDWACGNDVLDEHENRVRWAQSSNHLEINPGCRFCDGLPVCPLQQEQTRRAHQIELAQADTEELLSLMDNSPAIKKLLDSIQGELLTRARRGKELPETHKVIAKRSRTQYDVSEKELLALAEVIGIDSSSLTKTVLKSQSEVRSVLSEKVFQELTSRASSGHVIVPAGKPGKSEDISLSAELGKFL
ncbi:MAG: DUF2800 domain-containing protein [Aureliella sp.]